MPINQSRCDVDEKMGGEDAQRIPQNHKETNTIQLSQHCISSKVKNCLDWKVTDSSGIKTFAAGNIGKRTEINPAHSSLRSHKVKHLSYRETLTSVIKATHWLKCNVSFFHVGFKKLQNCKENFSKDNTYLKWCKISPPKYALLNS